MLRLENGVFAAACDQYEMKNTIAENFLIAFTSSARSTVNQSMFIVQI